MKYDDMYEHAPYKKHEAEYWAFAQGFQAFLDGRNMDLTYGYDSLNTAHREGYEKAEEVTKQEKAVTVRTFEGVEIEG